VLLVNSALWPQLYNVYIVVVVLSYDQDASSNFLVKTDETFGKTSKYNSKWCRHGKSQTIITGQLVKAH